MAYTARDSPLVVARVEHDLSTIVRAVRQADPVLRSLVLTGGFARGEGAVVDGLPRNDYDLVAIRGLAKPRVPYPKIRADLERKLGIHVDLAPVSAWRLRWVGRSIFWYETALRGRVLWGEDLLSKIRVRTPEALESTEGLRLLVNRAAGLLLAAADPDPDAVRLQSAKALLAAVDVLLLARGEFAPSQTERWWLFRDVQNAGALPPRFERHAAWFDWGYHYKLGLSDANPRDADRAWKAAATALLEAVPLALRHAGLPSLDAYARRDRLVDHVVFFRRAARLPWVRRLVLHPTGRVRVATLRLLEASLDRHVRPEDIERSFEGLVRDPAPPQEVLMGLRGATLQ